MIKKTKEQKTDCPVCQKCNGAMVSKNWGHIDPGYCSIEKALQNVGELVTGHDGVVVMPGHWTCYVCEDVQIRGGACLYQSLAVVEDYIWASMNEDSELAMIELQERLEQ